jgi:tubulin monoglycylase TTLL3/8
MHWFCENDVSYVLFPRCYNLCQPDELTAFMHDFRITACLGLLKWLVNKYENQGESSLKSVEGKVQLKSSGILNLYNNRELHKMLNKTVCFRFHS